MIDKKTVFVLGAGASCPYGYPSGAQLRKEICDIDTMIQLYTQYSGTHGSDEFTRSQIKEDIKHFAKAFFESSTKSIDLFMARNPSLVEVGKYIIALKMFDSEMKSCFREKSKEGQDWYFYLFDRLTDTIIDENTLYNFSKNKISFITFNYDRSLEQFLYESLRNSLKQVPEAKVINELNGIRIIHLYGQIAPLVWQDAQNGFEYKHRITHNLLVRCKKNIRTIYEETENPGLKEAEKLIEEAEQIFILGFGYAPENMDILGLPKLIPPSCLVYGTGFNLIGEEIKRIRSSIQVGRKIRGNIELVTKIESGEIDCLMLLRKYFN